MNVAYEISPITLTKDYINLAEEDTISEADLLTKESVVRDCFRTTLGNDFSAASPSSLSRVSDTYTSLMLRVWQCPDLQDSLRRSSINGLRSSCYPGDFASISYHS